RYSKTPRSQIVAKPTQQSFYPPTWRDVLDRAKAISRCEAIDNPFPARDLFIKGPAIEYLTEAVSEVEGEGTVLDGYFWEEHKASMAILLYEDIGTFRSEIKKVARATVKAKCRLFPAGVTDREACATGVREAVQDLLDEGSYLHGGVDEQGRSDNFASDILREVTINAFYEGKSALAMLFPKMFRKEAPRGAVALSGTILKNAIDEYEDGAYSEKKLSKDVYSNVYDTIISLMDDLDEDPYHSAKCRRLRQAWATAATYGFTLVLYQHY
ncbi:hypothetical protein BV22DRAFT_1050243, partial [Leucogyrophana mollusca]